MMHKRFYMRWRGKSAEFSAALVADHHGHDLFSQEKIDQCKNRQAQAISQWHQHHGAKHDQAADDLIEIFVGIKLPAGT